jgi:pimeloyl-ACP methyl ester carboxylesterase
MVDDITYISTWEGWLYLATVIDALRMAARNYPLAQGPIFHSDRGTQYTSAAFAAATDLLGIRRSVGTTGVCFDNALAESFNAAVKVERANRTVYPTREHARKDVTRYIEFRYNTQRLHSALGVLLTNGRALLAELDGHPFGPLMEHMSTTKLAAVRVPITWLLGTETRSEWFRKLHARAVQVVPNIRSARIAGVGHFGYLDAPEEFIAAVLCAVVNEP